MCHKTIIVQTYDDYPMYVTPDDETITRMLHLLSDKNKVHNEQSEQSVVQHTTEYKIDNRTVYDILDQNCKDTYMYIHMSSSTSPRTMTEEHIMPSTPCDLSLFM